MITEADGMDSFNLAVHYGYQVANYAMEPIRLYVWGTLRAFAAPSFDTVTQKTQDVFSQAFGPENHTGNLEGFKNVITQADFTVSSPYFDTKIQETAFRMLLGAAVIATPVMGTGIVGLPLAIRVIQAAFSCGFLGQILHTSLAYLSEKDYTVIQPENASKQIATCKSIASWNIGLVSVFAPLNVGTWESVVSFHWAKNALRKLGIDMGSSRIEQQAEVIRQLNADIIIFQEFFDPLQAKALHELVADTYRYACLDIAPHAWKGPSGLGVFSKIPLHNLQVHDFKTEPQGLDKGTNKKFVTFDVQMRGKKIRIYAAHLNCGNNPEARRSQLDEIKLHMDSSLAEGDVEDCMILGDLNFDRATPDAVDTKYFNDHFVDSISPDRQPIYTCSNVLKFKHSGSSEIDFESIDYIASRKGILKARDAGGILNSDTLNVSDHVPVCAEF